MLVSKGGDMLVIRKVLFAGKLALGLLLAFLVVRTVLLPGQIESSFAPSPAMGMEFVHETETARMPGLPLADYARIAQVNPFGGLDRNQGSKRDITASDQLGLVLLGTVSGGPAVARAVIRNIGTGSIDLYRTGQLVAGARIEAIEKEQIVLIHNGRMKVLRINIERGPNGDTAEPGVESTASKRPVVLKDKAFSDTGSVVRYKTGLGRVESILRKAAIKPYAVDGEVQGLKLTGLANIKAAKEFGLKDGDIICELNGHKLTSKQKAYQVFMKARSQPVMNFELLRNGRKRKLSFELR